MKYLMTLVVLTIAGTAAYVPSGRRTLWAALSLLTLALTAWLWKRLTKEEPFDPGPYKSPNSKE